MNGALQVFACAALLFPSGHGVAHQLDEYLQATMLSIERDRVVAQMYLTPGVAVFPVILAGIDTDGDSFLSEVEQRAYVRRILRDLSLTVDGNRLRLRLFSVNFPPVDDMKDGRGDIRIRFDASMPPGGGARRLTFENHHLSAIAGYLMNCLVPDDPGIRIVAQQRNEQQSVYRLEFVQE